MKRESPLHFIHNQKSSFRNREPRLDLRLYIHTIYTFRIHITCNPLVLLDYAPVGALPYMSRSGMSGSTPV